MVDSILSYLKEIFGCNFPDRYLREAFRQNDNRNLAEVGDSVLDLIIKEYMYRKTGITPKNIDDARQTYANNKKMKQVLNRDLDFTLFLRNEFGCTSPPGNIGLTRSDDYMEAIIGAIYFSKGLKEAEEFVFQFFHIE